MKKSYFLCLVLFIITAAIIVFCCHGIENSSDLITMTGSVDGSGRPTTESVSYDPESVEESFGLGLYDAPIHTPEHSLHFSQTCAENESVNGYLFISNQMTENNSYLIFCLMDYNQTPFSCDSDERGILHRVVLRPYEERFVQYSLDPPGKGIHDFEIFALLKTDQHSLDTSFRQSTDFSYLGSKRLNLFVENETFPVVRYTNFSSLSARLCDPDYPINDGILLTEEPCSTKGWFTEGAEAGDVLHYWINLAADTRYPVSFAVITLVDYVQVPLQAGTLEKVWFGNLSVGEKISVPGSIVVPSEEGVHELMMVYIPVPYQRLETEPGVSTEFQQWLWTEPSIRIGLNVSTAVNASRADRPEAKSQVAL